MKGDWRWWSHQEQDLPFLSIRVCLVHFEFLIRCTAYSLWPQHSSPSQGHYALPAVPNTYRFNLDPNFTLARISEAKTFLLNILWRFWIWCEDVNVIPRLNHQERSYNNGNTVLGRRNTKLSWKLGITSWKKRTNSYGKKSQTSECKLGRVVSLIASLE